MTRYYFRDAKPATHAERELPTLRYDQRFSLWQFPGDPLLGIFKQHPGIVFVESCENMDAPGDHSLVIDMVHRSGFNQRVFLREIDDRLRAVVELQLERERSAERQRQQIEFRRRARLGGGNAQQRRLRRRSLLRAAP